MSPEVLPPTQLDALLVTPVYLPLMGLYERIMVLESIRKKDVKYLVVAIGLHALLNYLAVSIVGYGVLYSELLITGFALGLGYWTYNRLRDEEIIG